MSDTEPLEDGIAIIPSSAETPNEADELALDEDAFFELVEEVFDDLPDDMVERLDNVIITVEDDSPAGEPTMLGLYEGVDIIDRSDYGFGEMPDKISLFRKPLLSICSDLDELREQIHITLVHEIAHHYGIDDDQLHELGWA